MVLAHRFAYSTKFGPIPSGMSVLHRCDNRPCCNPDHLFLGTQADNVADMMHKKRNRQPKGSSQALSKITEAQAEEIRALRGQMTQADIGTLYGIAQCTVSKIQRGTSWVAEGASRRGHLKGRWPKGDDHGRSKLTQEKADQIRALKGQKTQAELSEMFGISPSVVSFIHTNRSWVRT